MKKLIALAVMLTITLLATTMSFATLYTPNNEKPADPEKIIHLYLNDKFVGDTIDYSIENGRTLLPIRDVTETIFGATVDFFSGIVSVCDSDRAVVFTLGQRQYRKYSVNEDSTFNYIEEGNMETSPIIINGRSLVPLRLVADGLNAKIEWDGPTRTIRMTYHPSKTTKVKYSIPRVTPTPAPTLTPTPTAIPTLTSTPVPFEYDEEEAGGGPSSTSVADALNGMSNVFNSLDPYKTPAWKSGDRVQLGRYAGTVISVDYASRVTVFWDRSRDSTRPNYNEQKSYGVSCGGTTVVPAYRLQRAYE
jgi:hypothetical protein